MAVNKELIKRLQPANIYLNTGIYLLPVQQAGGKTYMACAFGMEAPASSITTPGMSVCRTYSCTHWGLVLERENKKSKENINISY